jgi:hypothetical protein
MESAGLPNLELIDPNVPLSETRKLETLGCRLFALGNFRGSRRTVHFSG